MKPSPDHAERAPGSPLLRRLRRFIDHPITGAVIVGLIITSVVLTIYEFALAHATPMQQRVAAINHGITWVFVGELTLRFVAMRKRRLFLREYWLDVLAVLPAFRVFRLFRTLRLLRLLRFLRLFRVGRLIRRHTASLPFLLRRSAVEYSLIACFLAFTIIFGASAMLIFEQQASPEFATFDQTFWWSVYTLLAGESITDFPATLPGRVVAATVMFLGLGVFALVTGTVSAVMVERLTRLEQLAMDFDDLEKHILICGFSRKVERIVDEIVNTTEPDRMVVLIAEDEHQAGVKLLREKYERVQSLRGDFTRPEILEQAGAARCDTCIIVADRSQNRGEQDADARTILAALTMEKLNPRCFTCAELNNSDYISHLERGGVDDVVIGGEHSAMLLAHAAITRGLGDVVSELLTSRRGSQFYKLDVPAHLVGSSFVDLLCRLKQEHGLILLGYEGGDGRQTLNPTACTAAAGDKLIVIGTERVKL